MNYLRRSWASTIASICVALALASGLAAHAMLSSYPGIPSPPEEAKVEAVFEAVDVAPYVSYVSSFFVKLNELEEKEAARLREEKLHSETVDLLTQWVKDNSRYGGRLTWSASREIVVTVLDAAVSAGLDPVLVLALIKVESNFNPVAVSSAGAIGLTQIIPYWHADKGVTAHTALDPEFSVHTGVKILVEYLGWHKGDLRKALLQYNGSLKIAGAKYADKVFAVQDKINSFVESNRHENSQGTTVQVADRYRDSRFKPS